MSHALSHELCEVNRKQTVCFKQFLLLFALVSGMLISLAVHAKITEVSAPEVKSLIETQRDLVLINTLSGIEHQQQHIPGSINISSHVIERSKLLPKDKQHPIVLYCMGYRCPYSLNAAESLDMMGYENIYWFKGGIPEWRKYDYPMVINKSLLEYKVKKIRPKTFQKLAQLDDVYVLDIRPNWWHTLTYIEGSYNIPIPVLQENLSLIPSNKRILIADGFMKQSSAAARYLKQQGYNIIGVLKGGIHRWIKQKMPLHPASTVQVLDLKTNSFKSGERSAPKQ